MNSDDVLVSEPAKDKLAQCYFFFNHDDETFRLLGTIRPVSWFGDLSTSMHNWRLWNSGSNGNEKHFIDQKNQSLTKTIHAFLIRDPNGRENILRTLIS